MTTIKKGSTGQDVKTLQKYLNLKQDGIFGSGTEAAVKVWQAKNGLTADGIVGPKSWELLLKLNTTTTTSVITGSKLVDSCVTYSPLTTHITKCISRTPKYLVIHYTAGGNSREGAAKNVKNVFTKREASADFCVDDASIYQFNPDISNYYCWAVGDKKNIYSKGGSLNGIALNKNCISIEICSTLKAGCSAKYANTEGWSFTDAAIDNAVRLSKILMKKYNIPTSRVIRHYDVTGKLCPGIIGWNNEVIYNENGKSTGKYSTSDKWLEFKNKLN